MNSKEDDLVLLIRKLAYEKGFCAAGIANIFKISNKDKLLEWISQGYHAEMKWMEESASKRIDILKVFPECKSVIVVAESYYKEVSGGGVALIARYAMIKDYHVRIKDKLQSIAEKLSAEVPELKYRIYVDSGSIMEKAWAVAAGIGWQGKNSLVITPNYGSWILLGVLLINVYLTSDFIIPSFGEECEGCDKCIRACPTGAIIAPYILDARKCISYLTIENKSDIPAQYLSKLNGYIFGCDICQEVCPYNGKVQQSTNISNDEMLQRYFTKEDLDKILNFSNSEFKKCFSDYPIGRIGLKRFKRNIEAIYKNIKE